MQNSNTYTFGCQQGHASLHRETTEDVSKMYTTLYDMEDPIQQQEYNTIQQSHLLRQQEPLSFTDVLASYSSPWEEPASPGSDCFSMSSSSSDSPNSSPTAGLIRMMNSDDADELADEFNITIEDLLSESILTFQYPGMLTENPSNFDLFEPLEQHQPQQQQHHHNMHSQSSSTSGGPIRSSSMSPIMSCAPYSAALHQYKHQHHNVVSSSQNIHFYSQSPEMPTSPTSAYTGSPSPCPSPSVSSTPYMSPVTPASSTFTSPSTTAAAISLNIPNTEGMTVIKNDDGSIMVYNPTTESMTFRCEICPEHSFGRIHDLKRHQASKHRDTTWPCEFCHRPFVRRDALLRHYTVKSQREDGIHPANYETEKILVARANAKLIR
ncbi:hypothetical protein BGX27_004487 [Mortierella sp. AM989]|nr:hypothetical protein BGX27_004487 [Mortierella sp. AM989]